MAEKKSKRLLYFLIACVYLSAALIAVRDAIGLKESAADLALTVMMALGSVSKVLLVSSGCDGPSMSSNDLAIFPIFPASLS